MAKGRVVMFVLTNQFLEVESGGFELQRGSLNHRGRAFQRRTVPPPQTCSQEYHHNPGQTAGNRSRHLTYQRCQPDHGQHKGSCGQGGLASLPGLLDDLEFSHFGSFQQAVGMLNPAFQLNQPRVVQRRQRLRQPGQSDRVAAVGGDADQAVVVTNRLDRRSLDGKVGGWNRRATDGDDFGASSRRPGFRFVHRLRLVVEQSER